MEQKDEMREALLKIVQARKREAFIEPAKATDEDAMGLVLSKFFQYDGTAIMLACSSALEDANFHAEAAKLRAMAQG